MVLFLYIYLNHPNPGDDPCHQWTNGVTLRTYRSNAFLGASTECTPVRRSVPLRSKKTLASVPPPRTSLVISVILYWHRCVSARGTSSRVILPSSSSDDSHLG